MKVLNQEFSCANVNAGLFQALVTIFKELQVLRLSWFELACFFCELKEIKDETSEYPRWLEPVFRSRCDRLQLL